VKTMLTQRHRHFALRLVLYDEDATLGPRIAAGIEGDPRWELIALCATLGDLNFVLNRVTVDVLLLHLTPESCGRVVSVASGDSSVHELKDALSAATIALEIRSRNARIAALQERCV
jgi:hypothetical protein